MERTPSQASNPSLVSRLKSHIIYHRVYADPPPRSELAPSQLTDEGLPILVPPPPRSHPRATPPPSDPRPFAQRPSAPQPFAPGTRKKLRLVCISDTHNHTSIPLPTGDILIHAGDLTNRGTFSELSKALSWLSSQPHEIKLIIAGNHDGCTLDPHYAYTCTRNTAEESHAENLALFTSPAATAAGVVYLNHEPKVLTLRDGRRIRVFASPLSPSAAGGLWGFGYQEPTSFESSPWAAIPDDTELLVTHTPPKYHLDASPCYPSAGTPEMHHGCEFLRQALWRVRPVLHVFGHIHQGRGVERVSWDVASSKFVKYREERVVRIEDPAPERAQKQFVVDTLRRREFAVERGHETLCVNASVATGSWKRGEGHPKVWGKPVVVDLEVACVDVANQDGVGEPAQIRMRGVGEGWNAVAVVEDS